MEYDKDHQLVAEIGGLLPPRPGAILEIGCGDGSLSVLLARHGQAYAAVDPDVEAIRTARSRGSRVDFRLGTGEALDFADASFDVVLFILSLHHQNGRAALEEAHRVLVEEGRLIVLEPSPEGELQQFFHLFNDEREALAKAAEALEQSRFRITDRRLFSALAEFDDAEDLCNYPFDRTAMNAQDRPRILGLLERMRGPFREAEPIRLQDTIHAYALRKAPPHGAVPSE